MPNTPKRHFDNDISRAQGLANLANGLVDSNEKLDVRRSAIMYSVGAFDAYFCDAYGDLVARTLRAKQLEDNVELPMRVAKLEVPIYAIMGRNVLDSWKWRMFARELIESDSVLSLRKVKEIINIFLCEPDKLFSDPCLREWIQHPEQKKRLFGTTKREYNLLSSRGKKEAIKEARRRIVNRFNKIFQRRHDCIHNCDRPKIAINTKWLTRNSINWIITDINFIVNRSDEKINDGYINFLIQLGFTGKTRNRVTQGLK